MAKIIVIRHAKSDWSSYSSDFDRGLTKRGYKSCQIISQELKKRIEKTPEKFLVSPAKRAQLTHQEIFSSWYNGYNLDKLTVIENSLYSGSNEIVLESIRRLKSPRSDDSNPPSVHFYHQFHCSGKYFLKQPLNGFELFFFC